MDDLLLRWRGYAEKDRYAAEYSKSETDAVWYRMVCDDGILLFTEFHASLDYDDKTPWPSGDRIYELIVRQKAGPVLATATAMSNVVGGDLEMRFRLPKEVFDLADARRDLLLGIQDNGTNKTGWTRMNDVARDVLMACTQG